jgi:hypothetical protein
MSEYAGLRGSAASSQKSKRYRVHFYRLGNAKDEIGWNFPCDDGIRAIT